MLSIFVRRVWDIPTLHFANWTVNRISASSRMCIEVKFGLRGTREAALRDTIPRPDVVKRRTSLQLKSRLRALRFGVD